MHVWNKRWWHARIYTHRIQIFTIWLVNVNRLQRIVYVWNKRTTTYAYFWYVFLSSDANYILIGANIYIAIGRRLSVKQRSTTLHNTYVLPYMLLLSHWCKYKGAIRLVKVESGAVATEESITGQRTATFTQGRRISLSCKPGFLMGGQVVV